MCKEIEKSEGCDINVVTAKVKWFNQFKGYGFVEIEGGEDDIFLHYSVVSKADIEFLNNNDIISCEITRVNNGIQVVKILKIIYKDKYVVEDDSQEEMLAVMKWFNPAKGYGFAQLERGSDVFIHSNLLKKRKIETINNGQKIKLLVRNTNHGYEAVEIVKIIN